MPLLLTHTWTQSGRTMAAWSAVSRQRLRQLKDRLTALLSTCITRHCTHLKNHGGVKAALRQVHRRLPHARFVARFDIEHYYQSMHHQVLLMQLKQLKVEPADRLMISEYLSQPDMNKTGVGMVAGGCLSPLLAAVYLHPLDQLMARLKRQKKIVHYTRYMDDYVILCKSRWQLKKAIAAMHCVLKQLHCRVHPNKRFIGKTTRRFDFLGYSFKADSKLRASNVSIDRFHNRLRRLYERGADYHQLLQYVEKWHQYHAGGLKLILSVQGGLKRHRKRAIYYLTTLSLNQHPHHPFVCDHHT